MVTKKTQTVPWSPQASGGSDDQRPSKTGTPSYVDDDEPREREGEGQSRGKSTRGRGHCPRKWKETSCLYLLAVGALESPMYKREFVRISLSLMPPPGGLLGLLHPSPTCSGFPGDWPRGQHDVGPLVLVTSAWLGPWERAALWPRPQM